MTKLQGRRKISSLGEYNLLIEREFYFGSSCCPAHVTHMQQLGSRHSTYSTIKLPMLRQNKTPNQLQHDKPIRFLFKLSLIQPLRFLRKISKRIFGKVSLNYNFSLTRQARFILLRLKQNHFRHGFRLREAAVEACSGVIVLWYCLADTYDAHICLCAPHAITHLLYLLVLIVGSETLKNNFFS